jgi:murein L,D-transpeptidase YafK
LIRSTVFSICLLLVAGSALAWEPVLYSDSNGPSEFLAVDKSGQELLLFSNNSPLQRRISMPCSTGQARGDKLREGDLKTPEGVYFIENLLNRDLDFDLYGNLAYTLNFPNPIDRLRGKTGHGIWIHGRGHRIVSFGTKGCIALNLEDIKEISDDVHLGRTPVVVAKNIQWESDQSEAIAEVSADIVRRTREWAEAWSAREDDFFAFYSPQGFSRAEDKSFRDFKNRKERLFSRYLWIDVWLHEPKAVRGPGYWVSYFGQVFYAPGFHSAGIKRLYWKKDETGRFRIVGSEWRGLERRKLKELYLKKRGRELFEFVRSWKEAWKKADPDLYRQFYLPDVVQEGRRGIQAVLEHKTELWNSGREPEKIRVSDFDLSMCSRGFCISFVQKYRDGQGYSDRGVKKLVVVPRSSGWKIAREEWRPVN